MSKPSPEAVRAADNAASRVAILRTTHERGSAFFQAVSEAITEEARLAYAPVLAAHEADREKWKHLMIAHQKERDEWKEREAIMLNIYYTLRAAGKYGSNVGTWLDTLKLSFGCDEEG